MNCSKITRIENASAQTFDGKNKHAIVKSISIHPIRIQNNLAIVRGVYFLVFIFHSYTTKIHVANLDLVSIRLNVNAMCLPT